MTTRRDALVPVSFKKIGGSYRGSVSLQNLARLHNDPAETMRAATDIYVAALKEMRGWQQEAKALRSLRKPLPAGRAWQLGDIVHRMNARLSEHGCKLESVYDHMHRHTGSSPKWLSRFVTLRRYVGDVEQIPSELGWNWIRDSVKSAGQTLSKKYGEASCSRNRANSQWILHPRFHKSGRAESGE